MGPHVGELPVDRVCHIGRENTGTHGDGIEELHDREGGAGRFPLEAITDLPSVGVGRPQGFVEELGLLGLLLAFKGYSQQPRAHVLHEFCCGDAKLEEEGGHGPWAFLY